MQLFVGVLAKCVFALMLHTQCTWQLAAVCTSQCNSAYMQCIYRLFCVCFARAREPHLSLVGESLWLSSGSSRGNPSGSNGAAAQQPVLQQAGLGRSGRGRADGGGHGGLAARSSGAHLLGHTGGVLLCKGGKLEGES